MITILIILNTINLGLVLLAYLTSFSEKESKEAKASKSIALSSLTNRKLHALLLGLTGCTLLALSSQPIQLMVLAILLSLATLIVSYYAQIKLTKALRQCQANQSIAVISLEGNGPIPVDLWLKKNIEEWPPINLEIGMGPWSVVAKGLTQPLLEKIRLLLKSSNLFIAQPLRNDLKKILNENGVTHPIDIEGADCVPEIKEFFELTLLKGQ
jgi:hypothetical protein